MNFNHVLFLNVKVTFILKLHFRASSVDMVSETPSAGEGVSHEMKKSIRKGKRRR